MDIGLVTTNNVYSMLLSYDPDILIYNILLVLLNSISLQGILVYIFYLSNKTNFD